MNFGLVAYSRFFLYDLGSEAALDPPAPPSACSHGVARNDSPLSSTSLTRAKWLSGSVAHASSPTCKDISCFVSNSHGCSGSGRNWLVGV